MRILLTCIEEPSHLRTMVPLAWGLMAAGHDVRAAGGPGITTTILEAGIPSVTVGIPSSAAELLSMAADQGDTSRTNSPTGPGRKTQPRTGRPRCCDTR